MVDLLGRVDEALVDQEGGCWDGPLDPADPVVQAEDLLDGAVAGWDFVPGFDWQQRFGLEHALLEGDAPGAVDYFDQQADRVDEADGAG